MCSSVETFETGQTRWWRAHCNWPKFHSRWCACPRMPGLPPSRSQPSSRLGRGLRGYKVCEVCHLPLGMVQTFFRWLYSCFLAIDANFRLKLKSRGINDPEIGSGWSYFVESQQYNKHISRNVSEAEVSPSRISILLAPVHGSQAVGCGSDFHAVSQANSKSSGDYIASGVVACVCARHSLMQKNAVGDLQRGER